MGLIKKFRIKSFKSEETIVELKNTSVFYNKRQILNNLNLKNVDFKRFPLVKILKLLPDNTSLFETILVSINDKFVELFLNNKIKFTDISKKMNKMLNLYSLKKYKKIKPKNIDEIIKMNIKIKNDIEKFVQK